MRLLLVGLVLFLGAHLVPVVPALRSALVARLGELRYRSAFALVSVLGLVLIVAGYAFAGARTQIFAPVPAAVAVAPYAMTVSFVLFAAANMRGHLRRIVRHPMLLGLGIWATVHLLANGDLAGTVLFGAFVAYALIDLVSAIGRGAVKAFDPLLKHDIIAVAGGVGLALLVMTFHRVLFGVPVVSFGV